MPDANQPNENQPNENQPPDGYLPTHVAGPTPPSHGFMLSGALYDRMKYVGQIVLPAFGALYFGIAAIWGLPFADEVVGTITVVDTFIGALLLVSSTNYETSGAKYDGVINVSDPVDGGPRKADLVLKNYENPADIVNQSEVTFKVNSV